MNTKWNAITCRLCLITSFLTMGWMMNEQIRADETSVESNQESILTEQKVLYGIGSTSKMVTTAAVMKLAEEGAISLDEPLITYLPEFGTADERSDQITPRMLLNHSSGLQGSTLSSSMLFGMPDTSNHDELLLKLKTQRLKSNPGEFSTYCNDGFTLAEILVERVSGMSFTEYIQKEFSEPLGLTHFATPQTPDILNQTAAVYDSETQSPLPPEMANVIGSGGIYATAEDLCRFSQIFMRNQGNASGILSESSVLEMEKSPYLDEVNPNHFDSTLSYGMGWDSVDTYPFNRYGIKAMSKGGDTSYYHSSLIVLPEENISCAVLSSGGTSIYNQIAVQEILLDYLEETGKVTRQKEFPDQKEEYLIEEDSQNSEHLSGLYAGMEMLEISVNKDGTLTLENKDAGKQRSQVYEHHENGRFYSTGGDYINTSGKLSHSSNGHLGKTFLEFRKGFDGSEYLMAGIYETYPKLGSTAAYLPIAKRIVSEKTEESLINSWSEHDGMEFYLVSEPYTSVFYNTQFLIKPMISTDPTGYLFFENSEYQMAAITGENQARFFQKIPGAMGRDLNDYQIEKKAGKTYFIKGDSRYLREDGIEPLYGEEDVVVIGSEKETVWKSFGEEQHSPVTIETSPFGAWYIYDHSGKNVTCVASSWTLKEGETFSLPSKGLIAFVGDAGTEFRIVFHPE